MLSIILIYVIYKIEKSNGCTHTHIRSTITSFCMQKRDHTYTKLQLRDMQLGQKSKTMTSNTCVQFKIKTSPKTLRS